LRIIMGEEACDSGTVKVSSNIKIAYMSQIVVFDDESATVFDTLRNTVELPEEKIRSILARFRFKAPDIINKVENLSGVEKSRLKLCLLMQSQANFLILDEPTNHLDIESRQWIEDAVSQFSGTMLFISHDRFFLNKFAMKIWSMKDGEVTVFDGGFEDYLRATNIAEKRISKSAATKQKKKSHVREKPNITVSIETQIYEAERELSVLDTDIASRLSEADYEKADMLYRKKHKLEEHVAFLYDAWGKEL